MGTSRDLTKASSVDRSYTGGGAGSGVVQEKAVLDDPIREMAVCRTDILLLYRCVPSVHRQTLIHTERHTLIFPEPPPPQKKMVIFIF